MKNEIKIPSMGESISEVTIGSLLVSDGEYVKADEPIIEIETDKVNQLLYAPHAGILSLQVKTGDVVKIGQVIGAVESDAKQSAPAKEKEPVKEPIKESITETKVMEKPLIQADKDAPKLRYSADTFVKEIKNQGNRISSVEKIEESKVTTGRETRRKMSTLRKVIAKRLVEVQQTTAMLTTFNEVDMSQVIQLREKYKDSFLEKYGVKLGFMPFFVKAAVAALQAFPDLNSSIDGDEIVHKDYYDIGIAVGTDKGLFVPVVRGCDHITFAEIDLAISEFAKKARTGTLAMADLQGGSFTITNGGVYGSLLSTPIINPPQSGILGMHKIEKRPVVVNDQIVIRPMMYLALSYDHRIVDGKEAVSFLVHMKNSLEDLTRLLIDI